MQTIANNTFAKLSVAFVTVAMMFSFVAPAQAQNVEDMSLEELIALVNSLTGGGSGDSMMASTASVCPYTWTRSLNMGATGADVMALQQFLNSMPETQVSVSGAGAPGQETQYYGPATGAAVSNFQMKYRAEILSKVGLVNPTTFFGPSTMAQANMLCASAPSTPSVPTTGGGDDNGSDDGNDDSSDSRDLDGGAGSIDDFDLLGEYSNEDVGEGDEDVPVYGVEIEADDASDIMITALDLNLSPVGSISDLDDYIDNVSIWFEGDKIAEFDVDEFDEDDDYDSTVSLGSDAPIIRGGDTNELVIAVSGIGNLDGTDEGDQWTIAIEEVRFRDGDGAVITDDSTGDMNTGAADSETFTLEGFAEAADLEFDISEEDDDINDERIIEIDDSSDTDDVPLLSFTVDLEGSSDVFIDELPFLFTVANGEDNIDDMITKITLTADGEEIGSESVSGGLGLTDTLVFEDLDFTQEGETEVEYIVHADFNSTDDGAVEGSTIAVEIGETETDSANFDVEDGNGDNLEDADVTGSANAGPHAVFVEAIRVEFVSKDSEETFSADDAGETDEVEFEFVFNVTALGDEDIFIDREVFPTSLALPASTTDGHSFATTSQTSATGTITSATISASDTDSDDSATSFIVDDGDTRQFTMKIVFKTGLGGDGSVQVEMSGVQFGLADADNLTNLYDFNLDEFLSDIETVSSL